MEPQRSQRGIAATKIQTPDLRLQTEKRTTEDTESSTQRVLKSWEKEEQKFFLNRNSRYGTLVVQRKTLRPPKELIVKSRLRTSDFLLRVRCCLRSGILRSEE
jgi:hypothetical protein